MATARRSSRKNGRHAVILPMPTVVVHIGAEAVEATVRSAAFLRIKFPRSGVCLQKWRNGSPMPNKSSARALREAVGDAEHLYMNRDPVNRRRARRESVVMLAYCRTATGRDGDVAILNLTAEGCCLNAQGVRVSTGLRVCIRPAQFEVLTGVVRWVSRSCAGIQFDKPLCGPAAEQLQRIWSTKR